MSFRAFMLNVYRSFVFFFSVSISVTPSKAYFSNEMLFEREMNLFLKANNSARKGKFLAKKLCGIKCVFVNSFVNTAGADLVDVYNSFLNI